MLIVDCDEQATSKNWIDRRDDAIKAGAKIPKIHIAQKTGKVYDAISDFASRYQLVIVDVGGGDTQETRTALAAADVAFIPFAASQADLETLDHINDVIGLAKGLNEDLKTYGLLSMLTCYPTQKHYKEAREFLADYEEIDLVNHSIGFR